MWPTSQFEYNATVSGTIPTYTITYNANGGAGAPANQIKTHGIAIQLSSTKPTREGYTFQGWARSATGVVEVQPGNTYRGDSNLILYAIWESNSATFHRYRPYIYNKTKNRFEPAKAYIRNNGTFITAAPHIWFD
jgi:uncharacterized repeat protein (TIGR02543 family)